MKCQFEIGSPVVIHRHNGRTDEPTVRPASALSSTSATAIGTNGHSRHSSSSTDSATAASAAACTKFTVTRVMEPSDPITCAGSGGVVYTAATGITTTGTSAAAAADMDEPCSSLDSSTSDSASFKHMHDLDTVPKRFGAKNRLVSVDSGFESIGKMRVIASVAADADCTLAEDLIIDEEGGDILEALRSEDARLNNNDAPTAAATATATATATSKSASGNCDIRNKSGGATAAPVKKNRTTTFNAAPENDSVLDPMLINKSDGLQDVLYYIDENGSPKIREKFNKKSRYGKKTSVSEEKKKKKQLTYGTEADIADAYAFDEKTPSCVSFSRICKRFKNSFRKCLAPGKSPEPSHIHLNVELIISAMLVLLHIHAT